MAQLYCKDADLDRIRALAEHETRAPVDQLTVLLNRYAEAEGLDPETMQPIEEPHGKNGKSKSSAKA